jgi:hypothetical protein
MNLARLIKRAKTQKPPRQLIDFCGDYYSPYYNFMYIAGMHVEGSLVELGCEKGRGLLALALTGNNVIGFDLNRSPDLDLSDLPNVTFFQESSLPVRANLFTGMPIGLLHLDTEHSYSQVDNEFNQYKPFLAKPALIIFDDLHAMDDDVKRFFDSLPYEKIQDDEMHPGCGWGVVLYE